MENDSETANSKKKEKLEFVPKCTSNTKKTGTRACLTPKDSVIIKEGELLKIGKRTGTMRTRYYILRDNALFIYNSKD
jgi:hypothetical protein